MHQERKRQDMYDGWKVKDGSKSSEEALRLKKERDQSASEEYYMVNWLENNLHGASQPKDKRGWLKFWQS